MNSNTLWRWIAVLPGATLIALAVIYIFREHICGLAPLSTRVLAVPGSILAGAAFVGLGSQIAPSRQRLAAIVLGPIGAALAASSALTWQTPHSRFWPFLPNWWNVIAFGAAGIAVSVTACLRSRQ
jgi:hypothetical protein